MPKISVVMPIYKGNVEYLAEAIESVLNQTFKDFEFIIVEEYGNSEDCAEVLRKYAEQDSRIRIITNEKKLGISESLNVGLRTAQGEYIARMDGDDISGEKRFEVQAAFLDRNKDICLVGIVQSVMNCPEWILEQSTNPDVVKSSCLFSTPIKHPTIMFRRQEFLEKNIFYNAELPGAEDYDLFLRASLLVKMCNIREPSLFIYRRSEENASQIFRDRDILIDKNLLKKFYKKVWNIRLSEKQIIGVLPDYLWKQGHEREYVRILKTLDKLLHRLIKKNCKKKIYEQYALEESARRKWKKIYKRIEGANGGVNKTPFRIINTYQSSDFYRK